MCLFITLNEKENNTIYFIANFIEFKELVNILSNGLLKIIISFMNQSSNHSEAVLVVFLCLLVYLWVYLFDQTKNSRDIKICTVSRKILS